MEDMSVFDEDRYHETDYDVEVRESDDDDDDYCAYLNLEAHRLNEKMRLHL